MCNIFTVRKRSYGKLMFSHLSVSYSVHRGGHMCGRGGHAWQGAVHGRGVMHCGAGVHGWGACMAGGVCGGGGACMAGGLCGRGHAWQERRPLQWTVRILLECFLVKCVVLITFTGNPRNMFVSPMSSFTHSESECEKYL